MTTAVTIAAIVVFFLFSEKFSKKKSHGDSQQQIDDYFLK